MAEFLRLTKPLDVAIAYVPRKAVWNETIPSFVRDELKAARTSANGRLDDEYLNDTDDFCFAEESDRLVIVDTCNPDFVDRDGHTPKIAASSRPSMGEEELAALSGNARTRWSSSAIEVESVIDHHLQQSWRDKWVSFPPTCELQIEEVASCATLVAERFARAEVVPSGLTVASRLAPSAFALQLSALTLRCMPSGTAAAHGDLEQQPRLPDTRPQLCARVAFPVFDFAASARAKCTMSGADLAYLCFSAKSNTRHRIAATNTTADAGFCI
eukprot:1908978-Rhodomonas_salina.1